MKYTSLDKVVKGYLLQKKMPIHFYIDFLIYAARCFQELHFDSLGNVRTQKISINQFGEATLPTDYMDWIKIGAENGQFVKPLIQRSGINRLPKYQNDRVIATLGTIVPGASYSAGNYTNVSLTGGSGIGAKATIVIAGLGGSGTVQSVTITNAGTGYTAGDILGALTTDIGGTGSGFFVPVATVSSNTEILYPEITNLFSTVSASVYQTWYNDRLEYTGRNYGANIDRTDSFKVIPERNIIQVHNQIRATNIVLEYISDGSEVDNATQITPYATSTIEAYINWKFKENNRSYGEGERMRAQRQFDHQHAILRGRLSDLTLSDIRAMIYKNSSGAPK